MPELSSLIRGKGVLSECVRMSLDIRSNKNVPNWVIYTPPYPFPDETAHAKSATMEDKLLDNRPSTSPYSTPIFYLIIGPNNVQYPIHQYFLNQSPEWEEKCKSKPWDNKIWLPNVNEDDSHALVHYLYTGTYQTLKPADVSAAASASTTGLEGTGRARQLDRLLEYKRSVRLYCAAKTYGLFCLETLCMVQIESFKADISIWDTLDIAEEAYKILPIDDVEWFSMYLEGRMEAAIEKDKHLLTGKKFLGRMGRTTEFDKALMKTIAQIYTGGNEPKEENDEDEDEAENDNI